MNRSDINSNKTIQKAGSPKDEKINKKKIKDMQNKKLWNWFGKTFNPESDTNKFVKRRLIIPENLWKPELSDVIYKKYMPFGFKDYIKIIKKVKSWYDKEGKKLPEFK